MVSSSEEILALFKQAAAKVLDPNNRAFEQMTCTSSIQEFGVDSIALFEIVGLVEDALRLRIPDEDLESIRTVQDLIDSVVRTQEKRHAEAGNTSS